MFDNGDAGNTLRYGSSSPPAYSLRSAVRYPVALYYGANDWIASPADVRWLARELGPRTVRRLRKVPLDGFNHMDFQWAKDADKLLYADVLQTMERF